MAAERVQEEVLNELYGQAALVGGNNGPPTEAETPPDILLDEFRVSATDFSTIGSAFRGWMSILKIVM